MSTGQAIEQRALAAVGISHEADSGGGHLEDRFDADAGSFLLSNAHERHTDTNLDGITQGGFPQHLHLYTGENTHGFQMRLRLRARDFSRDDPATTANINLG